MAANACLKNEFREDEKRHNLMRQLILYGFVVFNTRYFILSLALFCVLMSVSVLLSIEPRQEKTCLQGLRPE